MYTYAAFSTTLVGKMYAAMMYFVFKNMRNLLIAEDMIVPYQKFHFDHTRAFVLFKIILFLV